MLYFILFTAVFSAHQSHEGVTSFRHDEEVSKKTTVYTGVDVTHIDSVEGFPKFVALKFSWNEQEFSLNLTRIDKWEGFQMYYHVVEDGSSTVDQDTIDGTVTFTSGKISEVFEAYLHSDGMRYEFLPSTRHESLTYRKLYKTIGNSTRFMASRRRLINEFENCWPGQENTVRETGIGYVVDPNFVAAAINKRAGDVGTNADKVRAEVISINDQMNIIYRAQFGIMMNLQEIWDQQNLFGPEFQFPTEDGPGRGGFTLGCDVYGEGAGKLGIDTYLENFQRWRQINKPQTFGDWQLLTDCFPPPGTIGIAYVQAVCTDYGVGVNTFTDGNSQTWLTVAHEVGHNIGAGHSFENGQGRTGGIMDYGDGKINGQFQFNEEFRFNDICGTLQATMAGAGTVRNCWTPRGPEAGEVTYEWKKRAGQSISECLPAKSNYRYRTTIYDCQQLTGQVAGDPIATIATDSTLCDVSDKPIYYDTHEYGGGCDPDMSATCGNGNLEPGEQCEQALLPTAAQSCCSNTCQWSNSLECSVHKTTVDASFMYNNALYLFQGDQVFKYTGSATVKAWNAALDEGYPRPITVAFPGLAATPDYNSDIDSALVKPGSSELLIFKSFNTGAQIPQMNAMRYDLAQNAAIGTLDITAQSANLFAQCGKVGASLAFLDSMWLMCESLVQQMTYAPAVLGLQFLPDFDFQFPEGVQTEIEAAFHDSVSGESVFYNGGYMQRWRARTHVGEVQQMKGLGAGAPTVVDPTNPNGEGGAAPGPGPTTDNTPVQPPASTQCSDSCRTCNPDRPNICLTCRTIPTTPVAGGFCLQDNVVTYLGFDLNTDADAQYVKGGQQALSSMRSRYGPGLAATVGDVSQTGLKFNGRQKLEMADLDAKGVSWQADETLRIEAWFYPDPVSTDSFGNLPRQRFITLKDTNGLPLTTIDFYVEPRCVPLQNNDPNCVCIEKTNRFNQPFPAACHNGAENAQPYCYVSDACTSGIDGIELSSDGTRVPTGNKILLCSGADCQLSDINSNQDASAKQFKLGVKTPSNEFNCFVNAPLQVGQWNKLFFELSNENFVTGVGGLTHRRAFVNTAGNQQNVFRIGEWEIGADQAGIVGTLDHFQMTIGEPGDGTAGSQIGTDEDASGGSAGTMVGILAPVILIVLIVFACYYYRNSLLAKAADWSVDKDEDAALRQKDIPVAPTAKDSKPPTSGTQRNFETSNAEWYYMQNGSQVGPLADAFFFSRIGSQVQESTLVWNGTSVEDWVPAGEVAELRSRFGGNDATGEETLWNYVGPSGDNIGPISESELLSMNLPGDTYVFNGTTVNEWTYLRDTYLSGKV